ncbi:MAG: histone deacetylase [Pseudomonadota bacterium]
MAQSSMRTGVVADRRYLDHDPGPYHVESPQRLEAIYRLFEEGPLETCVRIEPRAAAFEELVWNHTERLIKQIAATAEKTASYLDPDTRTSEESYETALLAAGGVFSALDAILQGRISNGFALVRPPGHHAEADHAMGFCLFNNIALGAHYLVNRYGLKRILIVDWDLHHGNGTQHSFYSRSDVLYFSTHQFPYYPGTGNLTETGSGPGQGFTVNVPLSGGQGNDDYAAIFRDVLVPVASEYKPEAILVSAGFDIYHRDPLGTMKVSEEGFAGLTRILMDLADSFCGGKLLLVLEGGYNVEGQKESVRKVISELAGMTTSSKDFAPATGETARLISRVRDVQRKYWKGV